MSHRTPTLSVAADEWLARFILFSRWIRSSGQIQTVKPDAFIPHPYPDLSVTRHTGLSVKDLWRIGQAVADARPATLYGRADITAAEIRRQKLDVEPKPVPENLNHANITGWPSDKPSQKSFAQELAAVARYVPKPPTAPQATRTAAERIPQSRRYRWIWLAVGITIFGILIAERGEFGSRWQRRLVAGCAAAILAVCISRFQKRRG